MRPSTLSATALALGTLFASGIRAQGSCILADTDFRKVVLDSVDVIQPQTLSPLPDGRLLYIERAGVVKMLKPGVARPIITAKFNVAVPYDDGLIGMVLDPNFTANGWVYLYLDPMSKDNVHRVSRFTLVGDTLSRPSEKVILEVPENRNSCDHNGGTMSFDAQGNLYLSTGDDTAPNTDSTKYAPLDERPGMACWDAQKSASNTNDLRGKILRIHPENTPVNGKNYTIPAGNLFPVGTAKTLPEIYVMGVRNPFRITVDPKTGWLLWGEVGPDADDPAPYGDPAGHDEFNVATAAGNFGWPYIIADNKPFSHVDFTNRQPGPFFKPEAPVNTSPNNTGLTNLPPAHPATIWYTYSGSSVFKGFDGGGHVAIGALFGGRTAIGGPLYRYNYDLKSTTKLPFNLDGKWLIGEWSQNWLKVVTLDSAGKLVSIEPFLSSWKWYKPMDIKVGQDGNLYIAEFGNNWSTNDKARISRIEYTGTCQATSLMNPGKTAKRDGAPSLLSIAASGKGYLDVPANATRLELLDLQGKRIWDTGLLPPGNRRVTLPKMGSGLVFVRISQGSVLR